ncbi:MAG: glycosyltransferase family 4 protein [Candidatus Paceibacterota bacterium]
MQADRTPSTAQVGTHALAREEQSPMFAGLRVLHVIPQLGPGGAERALCTIMREQTRCGLVPLMCVLGSENAFPHRLQGLEPPEFLHYKGSRRDITGYFRCIRRLRQIIHIFRPAIVHSHLWPAARLVARARRFEDCCHVVHVQDTRGWLAGGGWRDRVTRLATQFALQRDSPQYIAVSRATRDYTTRYFPWITHNIPVVYNGLDEREFEDAAFPLQAAKNRSMNSDELVFGTAGRFSTEKGHVQLFEALAQLVSKGVKVRLRIAGDGPLRPQYDEALGRLGLTGRVEFCGRVATMAAFYRSLDVFVLPSFGMEGFPLSIVEAMNCGLPIVATDVPGAKEAVRHEQEGFIVPPGDPAALASALSRIAGDANRRHRMGANARERVREEFTGRKMSDECLEVYRCVLERKRNHGIVVPRRGESNRAQPASCC